MLVAAIVIFAVGVRTRTPGEVSLFVDLAVYDTA